MSIHGMRITVKDELSAPTKRDMIFECGLHGGVEKVRRSIGSATALDELVLLRIRHRNYLSVENESDPAAHEEPRTGSESDPSTLPNEEQSQPNPDSVLSNGLQPAGIRGDGSGNYSAAGSHGSASRLGSKSGDSNVDSVRRGGPRLNTTAKISVYEIAGRLRDISDERYDPNYIELDAGPNEPHLRSVAEDMKNPDHPLGKSVLRFRNRSRVHSKKKPEMQVQLAFTDVANSMAREFYEFCPGSIEDENGQVVACPDLGEVFASRGLTYVRQGEADKITDADGPKPDENYDASTNSPQVFVGKTEETPEQARERESGEAKVVLEYWIALNKPDMTNRFIGCVPLPETGIYWSQITFTFEVKPTFAKDSVLSLVEQAQRGQVNQVKHFPATGEILTLTICGPILRVWYMNPQRYGSTRGFSLEEPEDYFDIVKIVALFSGPVSNYLPHWKPVAGPQGRMAMKTAEGEPFLMELVDVEPIDTRYDPYGRRTAVWSAGLANVSAIDGGKNSKIPEIHLKKGEHLVIKTSWNLPHLRNHEQHVYQHIAKVEKELHAESGFKRDPEVAIPELVGTLLLEVEDSSRRLPCIGDKHLANWSTRLVPVDPLRADPQCEKEQVFFTVLVTKCRRAKPITHWQLSERQEAEIYRRLFLNLKHLAMLGVHYRDLNMGNILCDPRSRICLLADFDFARIENRRRGEAERESEIWQTSLDDCVSGNLLFMSRHVQHSRQRNIEWSNAQQALESTLANHEAEMSGLTDEADRQDAKESFDYARKYQQLRIDDVQKQLAEHHHHFVDDLESAIYTWLWLRAGRKAERLGLSCGPLGKIGSLDIPAVKEDVFVNARSACLNISTDRAWAGLISKLAILIDEAQLGCRSNDPDKRLAHPETAVFEACDRLMKEYVESAASVTHEIPTSTSTMAPIDNDGDMLLAPSSILQIHTSTRLSMRTSKVQTDIASESSGSRPQPRILAGIEPTNMIEHRTRSAEAKAAIARGNE